MNVREISTLARTARKAGMTTLLQLEIAGHLKTRGECTLISLSNTMGISVEAIAHASAGMETAGGVKAIGCREAVGFTLIRLTPAAEKALEQIVPPVRANSLR
jgi:hypothetical protein